MPEFRLLSTSGLLGYGFPEESLKTGMAREPHMIGVDGGSTDPGPHYLGSGKCLNSKMSMKRDIALMLDAALSAKIPMVISSCGGAGGEPHLKAVVDIVREVAHERGYRFKLATIHAEQSKAWVKQKLGQGEIAPLKAVPPLDGATIDNAERIVGMMGPEPYIEAAIRLRGWRAPRGRSFRPLLHGSRARCSSAGRRRRYPRGTTACWRQSRKTASSLKR